MDDALRKIFANDQQQAALTNLSPITSLLLGLYRSYLAEGATISEAVMLAGVTFHEMLEMHRRQAADAAKAEDAS